MIERIPRKRKTESQSKAVASAQAPRCRLFGQPQVLGGEERAAYDELLARICVAVKPVDTIEEMFTADIVSLHWEVLRWRRLKSSLILARGLKAVEAPEISSEALTEFLTSTPQGSEKFATILSEEAKRILAMDRYERRALFRRKTAIQLLDEAKHYDCN
jgi:hypothetical protein